MTDFLSRVAQRALGLGPAIQPLVVSRYAPARLQIPEAPESEPVSQMGTEGNRRNVEGPANVRSPSLISNPGRQPLTEQRLDDEPLRDHLNPLSEHPESSGPGLENQIPQPHSLAEFEAATPFEAAPFEVEPPNTTNTSVTTAAAVKAEKPSLLGSNLSTSEQQTTSSLQESSGYSAAEESSIVDESLVNGGKTGEPLPRVLRKGPALQDSTGQSAVEESSIVEEGTLTVENLEPARRVSSGRLKPPADRVRDGMQAAPGLSQPEHDNVSLNSSHHSRQFPETSDQGERNLQVDDGEDFVLEGDLRSLSAPERRRREVDSFTEVFAQKPVPASPALHEELVENGPPVIRVSIGRVEVRAVTPPPPAVEPPPPAAPKLSLDEFLRQPNGGRR